MKIAYICLFLGKLQTGVLKSLRDRAKTAENLGLDIDIFVINKFKEQREENVNYVKIKHKFPALYFHTLYIYDRNFRKYRFIEKYIDLKNYDLIILRYLFADKTGIEFARKFKVITEHHTDTVSEMTNYIKICRSLPRMFFRCVKKYFLEKRYGHLMLKNCKGIIAVTDEINNIELSRINHSIPSITIPNGIGVENIKMTGFTPFDGKNLDIVFITSSLFPWNGLERLLSSMKNYKGNINVTLHIIGAVDQNEFSKILGYFDCVKFHGLKLEEDLDEIMGKMNLAIGTLALFKNNIEEACSLKTREYVARGIPFVLAYKDPDLLNVRPDFKFHLSFENNNSSIDMGDIISFAREVSKNPVEISSCMRSYALQNLDWSIKMKKLMRFVENVENQKRITSKPSANKYKIQDKEKAIVCRLG